MIKILHLYYDLLNLYGEQGNILALKEAFRRQNVKVVVDHLSISDKINLFDYDIIYMGCGSNDNLIVANDDIKRLKNDFNKCIDNGKWVIATGNSYLLFGKSIDDIECMGIFDYYAISKDKNVCESLMEFDELKDIIGFQNRRYIVNINSNHLFRVKQGLADNYKSSFEGYHYNNFIGTYLVGPLLIRNPHFTNLIVKDVLERNNLVFHDDRIELLDDAYKIYMDNFFNK